jgi:molybdopterin molybdotransferase
LDGRVDSEPGVRTFATVRLRRRGSSSDESVADPIEGEPNRATDDPDVDVARDHGHGHGHDHDRGHDHEYVAVPARRAGGVLRSSVALSDGWVTVPESTGRLDAGSSVAVERWESSR